MKKVFFVVLLVIITACNNKSKEVKVESSEVN